MTKINIIYINLLSKKDNLDDLLKDKNSYVLITNDSLGNIKNYENLNQISQHIPNLDVFEKKLKEKIASYKFKTLQNRFYLPIGSSILLEYENNNLIYSPIMWVKQDISNTNNIYWSFLSTLSLILKNNINDMESKNLIIFEQPVSPTGTEQRAKAFEKFNDLNNENFIESLDYKNDNTIFYKESNISEQPPFLQNNEFRELNYN
ncbi:hypothetical protein CPAV1605_126 [seawater metagenome]|uniref:Uncharacterized protein n=1 Tax=seawater metagenome TaxID=1561972 RepID=A0A5E8CIA1_9ZZZZ